MMPLESMQSYTHVWHVRGDVYTRYYCQRCGASLPEGATEDDEICKLCDEETIGNNGEPIKNYPEEDWREDQ